MNIFNAINNWLETRKVTPTYKGWLLGGIAFCFFGSATNTMAGWLYVISGISLAILGLAAVMPPRSLRPITINRLAIAPVTVGDKLTIELEVENPTNQPKTLLQVQDVLPYTLGKSVETAIETIPPQSAYKWIYYQTTTKRGVYYWETVEMRTATPFDLFSCRRRREVPAKAIVYPTVLPLTHCPLIDEIGQEDSADFYSRDRRSQLATAGITRALRGYRVGDPTRLIHWRTSARYGELKVRELEVFTGGEEIIIGLDSGAQWNENNFEEAVITAASLYFYANRAQLNVKLWTARTGLVHGNRVVLEALAATFAGEEPSGGNAPNLPLIWLTQNPATISSLPRDSRWVLWFPTSPSEQAQVVNRNSPGIIVNTEQPLQLQLQSPLSRV